MFLCVFRIRDIRSLRCFGSGSFWTSWRQMAQSRSIDQKSSRFGCMQNVHSRREDEFWMPPKLDDFWPSERLWTIWCQEVYVEPEPKQIKALISRVRKAHRNTKPSVFVKLFHQLPARIQEFYRRKGKKILPFWDHSKIKYMYKFKYESSSS